MNNTAPDAPTPVVDTSGHTVTQSMWNSTVRQCIAAIEHTGTLQALLDGASDELPDHHRSGEAIGCEEYDTLRKTATLAIAKERALRVAAEETMVYQHKGLEKETTLRETAEEERDHWKQICLDLSGDAECLPECSGAGHSDDCPMMSAANYCKSLQRRIATARADAFAECAKICCSAQKHTKMILDKETYLECVEQIKRGCHETQTNSQAASGCCSGSDAQLFNSLGRARFCTSK